MDRTKRRGRIMRGLVATLAGPIGILIAKFHLVAPTPGMFFALGVLAALCAVGIADGIRDDRRLARAGKPIGN